MSRVGTLLFLKEKGQEIVAMQNPWLDGITHLMNLSLSKLGEMVKDRDPRKRNVKRQNGCLKRPYK